MRSLSKPTRRLRGLKSRKQIALSQEVVSTMRLALEVPDCYSGMTKRRDGNEVMSVISICYGRDGHDVADGFLEPHWGMGSQNHKHQGWIPQMFQGMILVWDPLAYDSLHVLHDMNMLHKILHIVFGERVALLVLHWHSYSGSQLRQHLYFIAYI
eukprot:Gb_16556 [translate_table: standard]